MCLVLLSQRIKIECLLLVVLVRLLKEGRSGAATRVISWGDERVGGVRRGRDWGGEDGTGSVGLI